MDWVKEKMYRARLQRNSCQEQIDTPNDAVEGDEGGAINQGATYLPSTQKLFWLGGGMALGAVLVTMVWRVVPIDAGNEVAVSTPDQSRQTGLLPAPSDTKEMKEGLVNLAEQVQVLTATIADLQTKLLDIQPVTNTLARSGKGSRLDDSQQQSTKTTDSVTELEVLPPPAAGLDETKTTKGKEATNTGDVFDTTYTATIEQSSADNFKKTQEVAKGNGPWVINLVSLPRKADAELFVEKAGSRGVDAKLYQVVVKGKTYWRVHVPGFVTAAEAKSYADVVKEKLGLKDVWVAKR